MFGPHGAVAEAALDVWFSGVVHANLAKLGIQATAPVGDAVSKDDQDGLPQWGDPVQVHCKDLRGMRADLWYDWLTPYVPEVLRDEALVRCLLSVDWFLSDFGLGESFLGTCRGCSPSANPQQLWLVQSPALGWVVRHLLSRTHTPGDSINTHV